MATEGVITRKDIITDDALTWGPDYAKQVQIGISANAEFVKGVKEINTLASAFRNAKGQEEYITLKNQQALANQKVIDSTKQLEAAELAAEKIAQARLRTEKEALAVSDKEAASKKRNTKLTIEERVQLEINNRLLKQQAIATLGLTNQYAALSAQRTLAKQKLLDLYAAEVKDTKAIKEATKAFEELDKRVRTADKAVGDFTKNVGNYPTLKGFTAGLKDLVGAFGLVGGVTAFAGILKDAAQTINKFEQSLADLSAITGASGKDLNYLRTNAIELGKGVEGGAIAVVEAYKLIAGAKPELLDNVQALNKVTDAAITLSQAAGIELPDAATRLTDAMNQFGAGADSAQEFIDALANGAKFGSAEIPQLTEAMLKFGAVARAANISVQESAALVELLAENGIKGADAGTALRNVLLKISAPDALPKEAKKALIDLGISFEFLKDKTVPVQEKIEALKPLLNDSAKLLKVFGFENVVAARNIIEHTGRLAELTVQMGTFGTAEEQAAIRMETVNGKMEKLKSTYDSFILSVGNGKGVISEFFKFFITGATNALGLLERWNSTWAELEKKAMSTGERIGEKAFEERMHKIGFITTSDSEKALEILRQSLTAYQRLRKEFQDKTEEINALEAAGLSSKVAREEREKLVFHLSAQLAIIKAAKRKINAINKPKETTDTPTGITDTGLSEKEEKERLKRLKALSDAEYELERARLERIIKVNQEIVDDQELTDDLRIASAENVNQKEFELIELTKKHKLDYDKFVLDSDKLNANQKLLIQEEAFNTMIDSNEKAQKQIEKIRLFDEESYKKSLAKKLSLNQIAENAELQLENEGFKELMDAEGISEKERERRIEDHERAIFEIKKKYAIEALKLQISELETELSNSDKLPKAEQLSAEKRQEIAEKLSKAKLDLSEVEVSHQKENNDHEVMSAKEQAEKILEISSSLTGALSDLASALFETKIQNIEVEIEKNNEYYDKQIEAAGDNEKQIALLEKEREKKNKVLEEKKKKEQHKQAVANKAAAIAQATISAALAVLAALSTQPFLPLGPSMAILAGVLGGIQIAAIAATPIPKYKTGRKGGPKEKAIVGDGGVPEVIERMNGKVELTPARDTLVELAAGDNVYKDIEDYKRNGRMSVMNSLGTENKKVQEYFNITMNHDRYGREMVTEMKLTRKAISKIKLSVNQQKPMDLNHEIWKLKNIKS